MDRGNMHIKTLVALAALLSLTACVTNPMTGRSQLSIVSEKTVMAKGAEMYSSLLSSYDKNGKLVSDEGLNTRLRTITNRLVEQAVHFDVIVRRRTEDDQDVLARVKRIALQESDSSLVLHGANVHGASRSRTPRSSRMFVALGES